MGPDCTKQPKFTPTQSANANFCITNSVNFNSLRLGFDSYGSGWSHFSKRSRIIFQDENKNCIFEL